VHEKPERDRNTEEAVQTAQVRKRDYKKEYREYHGKPEQIKNRSDRNKARRILKLKTGDKREIDHKVPLSKGGSNDKENLRLVSRRTNRKKYNK
jgi:5-methylcytosine-specific restriction endonuclease McrA